MGILSCKRCFATAEGNTQAEADDAIDHARGQMIGRPCSGKQEDLVWEGSNTTTATARVVTETVESPTKTKKKSKRGE